MTYLHCPYVMHYDDRIIDSQSVEICLHQIVVIGVHIYEGHILM